MTEVIMDHGFVRLFWHQFGEYSNQYLGASAGMKKVSAILLVLSTFAGCSPHPITDAVCVSQCLDTWEDARVLIWTNESKLEPLLADWVRKHGGQVIDSEIVGDAIRRNSLMEQSAREIEQWLQQLGRMAGANRVLAAMVERHSYPLYNLYSGYKEGHPRVTTLFDPTVTIRSLSVVDATTQWSVTARGGSTSFVYDIAVTELAETALERAACEANPNTRWKDERGCIEKSQV
jgi:hypothetical protein